MEHILNKVSKTTITKMNYDICATKVTFQKIFYLDRENGLKWQVVQTSYFELGVFSKSSFFNDTEGEHLFDYYGLNGK